MLGPPVTVEVVIDTGVDPWEARIRAAIEHRRELWERRNGAEVAAEIERRLAERFPDEPEGWLVFVSDSDRVARLFRVLYRDDGRVCASRYVWSVDAIDWTIEYLLDLAPRMKRQGGMW